MASSGAVRAGGAFVEIFAKDGKLRRTLASASRRLSVFSAKSARMGGALVGVAAAAAAPMALALKTYAAAGDAMHKMSMRTGLSSEALSELSFAADQSGASIQTVEAGVRRMSRVISDAGRGMKSAADALDGIGLSAEQLAGMSPEQQFMAIAEGLSRIPDASKRAALAQELLGRSGTQLLPMFANGAAGIDKMREQAAALGLTVSSLDAEQAARLTDAFDVAGKVLKRAAFSVGAALAPMAIKIAEAFGKVAARLSAWISENRGLVTGAALAAAVVGALGGAFLGVAVAAKVAAVALGLVSAAVGVVGFAITALTSPLRLVLVGVTALAVGFDRQTGVISRAVGRTGERLRGLKADAVAGFQGVRDALEAGDISAAWQVVVAGLRVAWFAGLDAIRAGWGGLVGDVAGLWLAGVHLLSTGWDSFATYIEDRFRDAMRFVLQGLKGLQNETAAALIMANPFLTEQEKAQQIEILREDQGRAADRDMAAGDAERVARAEARAAELLQVEQDYQDAVAALQEDVARRGGQASPELDAARRDLTAAVDAARAARDQAAAAAAANGAGGADGSGGAGLSAAEQKSKDKFGRRERVFVAGNVARRQAAFAGAAGPVAEQGRVRAAVLKTDDAVKKSAKTWDSWKNSAAGAAAAVAAAAAVTVSAGQPVAAAEPKPEAAAIVPAAAAEPKPEAAAIVPAAAAEPKPEAAAIVPAAAAEPKPEAAAGPTTAELQRALDDPDVTVAQYVALTAGASLEAISGVRFSSGELAGDAVARVRDAEPKPAAAASRLSTDAGPVFDADAILRSARAAVAGERLPTVRAEMNRPELPGASRDSTRPDPQLPILRGVLSALERMERKPGGARFG
jgi:hypothetical protein